MIDNDGTFMFNEILFGSAAFADDVTGKWQLEINDSDGPVTTTEAKAIVEQLALAVTTAEHLNSEAGRA